MSRLAKTSVTLLLSACSTGTPETAQVRSAIWGGEPVHPAAFPNVVWLDSGCTGVVLDSKVVVFSAHCETPTKVFLGDSIVVSGEDAQLGTWLDVEQCSRYPGGSIGSGRDLAYCVSDALSQVNVPSVAIISASERELVAVGDEARLVGFGAEYADGGGSGVKRAVDAKVESLPSSPGTGEIIIGSTGDGTCRGDSGGPAFVKVPECGTTGWRVLGILSSGAIDQCGTGWYTDVSLLAPWLPDETGTVGSHLTPCSGGLDEYGLPALDARAPAVSTADCSFAAGGRHSWIGWFGTTLLLVACRARRRNRVIGLAAPPPRVRVRRG